MVRLINRVTLAAIFVDLRRALWLGLCVADSLGEHLAKLSLGLRRFAREGFLPLGHGPYVGMPEGELNPFSSREVAMAQQGSPWFLDP
jgi:hypothetical protein